MRSLVLGSILGWLVSGALASIWMIGKRREIITPLAAIFSVIATTLLCFAIFWLATS